MTEIAFRPEAGLVYLPLADEVIPLLKRAVIPLTAPEEDLLPGYPLLPRQAPAVQVADYQAHMEAEYQRLPESLRGLLTLETFLRQAESKRGDIEQQLLARAERSVQQASGDIADWVWQSFYTDSSDALAWSLSGYDRVWLGIDPQQWPEATLEPVSYDSRWPDSFPQRLLSDAPTRAGLQQQRLLLARAAAGTSIRVGGRQQWLLRLPPKALRVFLLGAALPQPLSGRLRQFLSQDFRYQRIPLATMTVDGPQIRWFTGAR